MEHGVTPSENCHFTSSILFRALNAGNAKLAEYLMVEQKQSPLVCHSSCHCPPSIIGYLWKPRALIKQLLHDLGYGPEEELYTQTLRLPGYRHDARLLVRTVDRLLKERKAQEELLCGSMTSMVEWTGIGPCHQVKMMFDIPVLNDIASSIASPINSLMDWLPVDSKFDLGRVMSGRCKRPRGGDSEAEGPVKKK